MKTLAFHVPRIIHAKQILRRSSVAASKALSAAVDVSKGHFAVYVGESEKKRFVVVTFISIQN